MRSRPSGRSAPCLTLAITVGGLLRDKIRNMFGADWGPGGKLVRGAMPYLERTDAPRGVRIGDRNYVAVTGCAPGTCRTGRVVLLIQYPPYRPYPRS